MKRLELNTALIDSYFGLLKNLSYEVRLELLARISNSLVKTEQKKDNDFFSLFGSFKSRRSADQIIADLKAIRTFTRQTEGL